MCGTSVFGQTELGVRIISLLIPVFSALLLQWLVKLLYGNSRAAWLSAIAFLLSPLGGMGSFVATTDAGLVLFWLLSMCLYVFFENHPRRFVIVGSAIALGALWKWMIYVVWIPLCIHSCMQKRRLDMRIFWGILVSLLGLLPSFFWNMEQGWPTFRHVGATIFSQHEHLSPNPISFFFAGVALISPGFFLLALPAFFSREIREKSSLLQWGVFAVWGLLLVFSVFRKVQGNWAVVAQVMMLGLVGAVLAMRPRWERWPYMSACVVSVVLQAVFFLSPYVGGTILQKSPLRQGMGCHEISECLERVGYGETDFLCSDRYQTVSQLWFYGPHQKKVYFFNIHNLRKNQFCFWPGMKEECIGKNGFFVTIIPFSESSSISHRVKKIQKELRPYFKNVLPAQITWLHIRSVPVRCMIIIRVEGYNGKIPVSVDKY
jgi:hypothetical protein